MTAGVYGQQQNAAPAGPTADEMLARFESKGPCAEYRLFEESISPWTFQPAYLLSSVNIWDFVADAIEGKGGFISGNYLVRFQRETKGGKGEARFRERIAYTKYDNFARRIADAPWNRIITHKDSITRDSKDERVLSFWAAADRRRQPITNAIEYPARQARSYGTGWILVDRPENDLRHTGDDIRPENAPYCYCVPSRNVVDWEFDDDYRLVALSILEPEGDDDDVSNTAACSLRVWTKDEWAVYEPSSTRARVLGPSGPNLLGEVPAVQIFDGYPGPGRGFGLSVMPTVARFERDVYNKTSEARSIMRKCAAFLGIPVRNLEEFLKKKIDIGEDVLVPYDGQAGKPEWVSPPLEALDKLAQAIKDDKEAAFELAQMTALSGYLQTRSGFHMEAIFQEANTAIASFATQLEQAETGLIRLVLRYHGETDEKRVRELASVSYPTEFGIVDKDAVIARAEKRLGMDLGAADAEEAILEMYIAEKPREDRTVLRDRAKAAAAALYADKAAQAQAAAQSNAGPPMTARQRLGLQPKPAFGKPIDQGQPKAVAA